MCISWEKGNKLLGEKIRVERKCMEERARKRKWHNREQRGGRYSHSWMILRATSSATLPSWTKCALRTSGMGLPFELYTSVIFSRLDAGGVTPVCVCVCVCVCVYMYMRVYRNQWNRYRDIGMAVARSIHMNTSRTTTP